MVIVAQSGQVRLDRFVVPTDVGQQRTQIPVHPAPVETRLRAFTGQRQFGQTQRLRHVVERLVVAPKVRQRRADVHDQAGMVATVAQPAGLFKHDPCGMKACQRQFELTPHAQQDCQDRVRSGKSDHLLGAIQQADRGFEVHPTFGHTPRLQQQPAEFEVQPASDGTMRGRCRRQIIRQPGQGVLKQRFLALGFAPFDQRRHQFGGDLGTLPPAITAALGLFQTRVLQGLGEQL